MTGFASTRPRPRSTSSETGRPPMASTTGDDGAGDDGAGDDDDEADAADDGGAPGDEGTTGFAPTGRIAGLTRRIVGVRCGFGAPGTTLRFAFTGRCPSQAHRRRTRAPPGTRAPGRRHRPPPTPSTSRRRTRSPARGPPGGTPCAA